MPGVRGVTYIFYSSAAHFELPIDSNHDAAVGDEVERTAVVNFADEVDGVTLRVGGNADGGYRLVSGLDSDAGMAYLRLLPPKEGEGVAVGVG